MLRRFPRFIVKFEELIGFYWFYWILWILLLLEIFSTNLAHTRGVNPPVRHEN